MSSAVPLIRIFQIHYRSDQISHLDPEFVPYDNSGDASPLLEFNAFRKIAAARLAEGADLWGAVSWKFGSKTGLAGDRLVDLIRSNPGYDVYFCNPFPETEALYHNLWCQGETAHPDFLNLSFDFLQAAGLPTRAIDELTPSWLFAATNSFVATPAFWQDYLSFVETALRQAEANLLPAAKIVLFSSLADRRRLHAEATYLPFIIERLFSLFLSLNQDKYTAFKYLARKPESPPLNHHLKALREMKDKAIVTQDKWLAGCWLNYCSTYAALNYGVDWARQVHAAAMPVKLLLGSARATVHQQGEQDKDADQAPAKSASLEGAPA